MMKVQMFNATSFLGYRHSESFLQKLQNDKNVTAKTLMDYSVFSQKADKKSEKYNLDATLEYNEGTSYISENLTFSFYDKTNHELLKKIEYPYLLTLFDSPVHHLLYNNELGKPNARIEVLGKFRALGKELKADKKEKSKRTEAFEKINKYNNPADNDDDVK